MTTPPDADDVPEPPEPSEPAPAHGWAPPDAPLADPQPANAQPADTEPADALPATAPLADSLPAVPSPPEPPHSPGFAPPAAPSETPYAFGPPVEPARRRTNRLAIVALVTGLVGLVVVAIGFSVAAFVQMGRRGEKGKGLAAGGLAASAAWVAAIVAVSITLAVQSTHDDTVTAAPAAGNGKPRVNTLQVGDCFDEFQEDLNSIYVNVTSCTGPHEGEIGAALPMPARPYPGDVTLVADATKACKDNTKYLMANPFGDHLELHVDRPRRKEWEHGDRLVTCVLRYTGKRELSGTLGSLHWGPRSYLMLEAGDCIKKWAKGDLPVVSCTEKHEEEVYATYDLSDGPYPGLRPLQTRAAKGCGKRAKKLFKSELPRHVFPDFAYPSKEGWKYGDRRIICMFYGIGGPLTHSVMPG